MTSMTLNGTVLVSVAVALCQCWGVTGQLQNIALTS